MFWNIVDYELSHDTGYVKNRLDHQIGWYSKKATDNKKWYYFFQVVLIITSAMVPIINVIDFAPLSTRIISSVLGSIMLGITSVTQLKKHHENWIMYRSTEEALKKEKYTYENNAGVYGDLDDRQKLSLLVEKVESIISNQNVLFFVTHKGKSKSE